MWRQLHHPSIGIRAMRSAPIVRHGPPKRNRPDEPLFGRGWQRRKTEASWLARLRYDRSFINDELRVQQFVQPAIRAGLLKRADCRAERRDRFGEFGIFAQRFLDISRVLTVVDAV